MEIKKEDLVLIRSFEDKYFYAIKPDYFEDKEELINTTAGVMTREEFEADKAIVDAAKVAEELIAEELRIKEEEKARKKAEAAAKRKATLEAKKAAKLKELEELKAQKLLELEALEELEEETEEE